MKVIHGQFFVASIFAAALLTQPAAVGHEGHEGHDAYHGHDQPEHEVIEARGIVFHDLNGNSIRDADEPGIANIKVSNGRVITQTDAEGRYTLKISDDSIVFVIKPRGWMTPVNEANLPQFYYIHKPAGSPADFRFAGVSPTGPLPESIDFPLVQQDEPDSFKAILFGDTQPRNLKEVEYITHDVIEQVIANEAHGAAFGVTLGDIVFDDLSVMEPLNQAIALIGIPWYNVLGNHDINYDAANDRLSDETFERIYGPSYYSFDYGPTHFLVLDDVTWVAATDGQRARYHGGLGARQMEFIRNDLELIDPNQLVVLMMHIPLTDVEDRQDLYRLIEKRPATVSLSAHTHYMEHRFIGEEDGWQGPQRHHHVVNVTVCGSWWAGQTDERGIPHATMSDGAPNGYSIMEFRGDKYALQFRAAGKPAETQMNIYAPESIEPSDSLTTVILANIFAASEKSEAWLRVGSEGSWRPMEQVLTEDPAFVSVRERETAIAEREFRDLPRPHLTPHMYRGMLPDRLAPGTHLVEIKSTDTFGQEVRGTRVIRVDSPAAAPSTSPRTRFGTARRPVVAAP